MDRYFYKVVDNIDFVWKIEKVTNDPYKANEVDYGHYLCNNRQFISYLFDNIEDIVKRNLLNDYKEIKPGVLDDSNCYFDPTIGLLHKDDYWHDLHAVRYVNCLERMSPILFGDGLSSKDIITETDRDLYQRLMTCDKSIGQKIYQAAYDYFKGLWEVDDYYAGTNLDTLEKFLPTINLQAISLWYDEDENQSIAGISFRPSWDEEHGLRVRLDLDTFEVKLKED